MRILGSLTALMSSVVSGSSSQLGVASTFTPNQLAFVTERYYPPHQPAPGGPLVADPRDHSPLSKFL
ncbi:unnamed protein product [Protopolystoma xenopodis]|uniref:Uncharacterized protein n=1 Tax=Protopolystoma xenopodis TaxID=117903 RepID=A0A3S5B9M1_9PLAT|nr:unnamed protein product [Protopolystoma xenopodis]